VTIAQAVTSIGVETQRPELPELHLDQRWRARCKDCGWAGAERRFRERAAMDGRKHECEDERQ
jgi:hypothetical protein